MDKRLIIILACIGGVLVAGLAAAVIVAVVASRNRKEADRQNELLKDYYTDKKQVIGPQVPEWV